MTEGEQKSIIIDVQMPKGYKMFALEFDKKLRDCTEACRSSALKQGITKGDEVIYSLNAKDQFSFLRKTGEHFDLKEQPAPASEVVHTKTELPNTPIGKQLPIIDAEKPQYKFQEPHQGSGGSVSSQPTTQFPTPVLPDTPKTDWQRKFELEQEKNKIIHWQAILNTATEIVIYGGRDYDKKMIEEVEETADELHRFIMEKVGEGK